MVYTDDHHGSFPGLAPERAEALMWVWRHRYSELGRREDVEYVMIFENRGVEVGVTLHHPHGQIYAYPFLPPVPALRVSLPTSVWVAARPCALLERELADRQRLVHENDALVAYVPLAARWPYETHVVMREHRAQPARLQRQRLKLLAAGLQAVTRGFDALFDRPFPYMMVVHQAPTGVAAAPADTCTSSSTRRCALPRSSSTSPAQSRAPARSSQTRSPRSPPRPREAIASAV